MQTLIWIGAAITMLGIAGIFYVMLQALKAKQAGLEDAALRARLESLTPWNMGALFTASIGLMLVIAGIILG